MTTETHAGLVDRLLAREPRALARAISLVENETAAGADIVRRIFSRTGRAYLVGVTGPPGAGKSTLVDRLVAQIRREGKTAAVIAVDPTSPFSGGALLGDRVRMGEHARDEGVFIRSMATRGHLGGIARTTGDAALVLDAAGFDVIVVETVGVGQDEVEIVRTADVCLVLFVPGTGDEIQTLKAGIMEIADIFVVNKADRDDADRVVQALVSSLSLQAAGPEGWMPPVLKAVATTGSGVPEVWQSIATFREQVPGRQRARQRARQDDRVRRLVMERLSAHVERTLPGEIDRIVDAVTARQIDPYSAADALVTRALGEGR